MDAAVVWVDTPEPAPPPLLQRWASARGLRLVEPAEGGSQALVVDPTLGKKVEEDLRAARELLARQDADGTERLLARAEAVLRAHPELPQAAWLLAEVERGWADRFAQLAPVDLPRAELYWRTANALDGGRAPGIGEPSAAPNAPSSFTLDVAGHADEVFMDGRPIAAGASSAVPGLHQIVAMSGGNVLFAQWAGIAPGGTVHVVLPAPAPCSQADFAQGMPGAFCASWIRVRREQRGFVVQSCDHATCGAELLVAPMPATIPNGAVVPRRFPSWAAWTLGVGGFAALGVLAGVITYFAVPPAQRTVFETGGRPSGQ